MSDRSKRPTDAQYREAWIAEMVAWCPSVYPCGKCGWPVIKGYCCGTCGDDNPQRKGRRVKRDLQAMDTGTFGRAG